MPSSQYGIFIDLIEMTKWTPEQIEDAPADLIDEMLIRISEKGKASKRENKANAKSSRRR